MPRSMTMTCYLCNEPMWAGTGSKPQGEAAHRKCREAAPKEYSHGTTGYRRGCRCGACKAGQKDYHDGYREAFREQHGVRPNVAWRKKFRDDNGYWPEQRRSDWIAPKVRRSIYDRDNWTCQLCKEPIDRDAHWNDNYAPSLDHIIPQSHMLIPDHSPSNLRTSHRVCNSLRGDRVEV
jgi:5-methylcytosine-specific restriction endonuclease McrA